MIYPISTYALCIAILGLTVTGTTNAQNIYKWKDQNGTTHYDELPPPSEFSSVEILDIQPPEPVSSNNGNNTSYHSTLKLANSLQVDRLKREKLRLEKARLVQQGKQARLDAKRYSEANRPRRYNRSYPYPHRSYPRQPRHDKPHPRPPQNPDIPKRVHFGR